MFSGIRDFMKEILKLFTGIVIAVCTVHNLLFFRTFSYLANSAVAEKAVAAGCAAKTVDISRFYIAVVLF